MKGDAELLQASLICSCCGSRVAVRFDPVWHSYDVRCHHARIKVTREVVDDAYRSVQFVLTLLGETCAQVLAREG